MSMCQRMSRTEIARCVNEAHPRAKSWIALYETMPKFLTMPVKIVTVLTYRRTLLFRTHATDVKEQKAKGTNEMSDSRYTKAELLAIEQKGSLGFFNDIID